IQVRYKGQGQFYGPSVTDTNTSLYNGIYLAVGNQLIGPDNGAGNSVRDIAWKSAGAQTLTGSGTEADPFIVTTRLYYDVNNNNAYNAATDYLVQIQTLYAYP